MRKRAMLVVPMAIGAKKFLTEERRAAIRQKLEKVPERLPDRVGPVVIREQKPSRKRGTMLVMFGTAIGAAIAYFFDPERGRARRAKALGRMHQTPDEFDRRRPEFVPRGQWSQPMEPAYKTGT